MTPFPSPSESAAPSVPQLRYLHTMIRVQDLDRALTFFCQHLGLVETRRSRNPEARFDLIFLATAPGEPELELTYNYDNVEPYTTGRNFGHLAYAVADIYEICHRLRAAGVAILRPPRDGRMAFIKSPDGISVELLQAGPALAPTEPWLSMPNQGSW